MAPTYWRIFFGKPVVVRVNAQGYLSAPWEVNSSRFSLLGFHAGLGISAIGCDMAFVLRSLSDNKASFIRGICRLPELPYCGSIQHTCQQVVQAHIICRFLGAQYFLKTPVNLPTRTGQARLRVDVTLLFCFGRKLMIFNLLPQKPSSPATRDIGHVHVHVVCLL
ncbi:hypothetical protein BDR07DRAFT_1403756 [Suillus spraguei]|nr:hypothetical protein BDR07DRAFT_1403756 [Suillus spraguei]